jgi:hypothetical protein
MHGAKRCQLVVDHLLPDVPHARLDRGGKTVLRWDASGSWIDPGNRFGDPTAERLPWHSMGYD